MSGDKAEMKIADGTEAAGADQELEMMKKRLEDIQREAELLSQLNQEVEKQLHPNALTGRFSITIQLWSWILLTWI